MHKTSKYLVGAITLLAVTACTSTGGGYSSGSGSSYGNGYGSPGSIRDDMSCFEISREISRADSLYQSASRAYDEANRYPGADVHGTKADADRIARLSRASRDKSKAQSDIAYLESLARKKACAAY